nr:restriction endonuclease subunit S [Eubacteriales bacterium]
NYLVSLPPLNEQKRIISAIKEAYYIIENIEKTKLSLIEDVKKAKSKILDLAIRGKLVPQDPNDEPASVLLERIRAEKEELIKQGKIKRDKKESVIFKGDDNSYYEDLPDQWVETKLSTISEVITKGTTPRGGKVAYADNGIGFLRAENIAGYEKLALNNLNYVDDKSHNDFLKRSILKANDILITIAGTLGRTAVVPCEALPLNTNQAVAIVRLVNCKLVNVKFVIFAINSPAIKKDLLMQSVDMAIPNLSLENISNCTIPLPPLAEQRRIVNTIEALFAQIDKIAEQIS